MKAIRPISKNSSILLIKNNKFTRILKIIETNL